MQLLQLPEPKNVRPKDRWFADRLQFTPDGQRLWLRLTQLGCQGAGQLDVRTGTWQPFARTYDATYEGWPQQPWSPNCDRVISYIGPGSDEVSTVILVDDPNETPPVFRSIVASEECETVKGVTFSPDGRWLYGADFTRAKSSQTECTTGIARADVCALFAKPVLEAGQMNPRSLHSRSVSPTRWKPFVTLPGIVAKVLGVSPDNSLVGAGTSTGDTYLIRVRGGQTLGVLTRKRGKRTEDIAVRQVVFSPSGKQLAVVVDGVLQLCDGKTAKLLWDADNAKALAIDVAYHPDGKTLAVARADGAAVFLDAQSGTMQKRFDWKLGQLNSIAFSSDGLTCAAGGEKGQVVVWDVEK